MRGLPQSADTATVKKVANVKHVISADVQHDNLTGACRGDARIKIRLNDGETEEQIKRNFMKAGYWVTDHHENQKKNTKFSGPPKDDGDHKHFGAKDKKAFEMATKF